MEKKINLKSFEILNKKFKTEISGYSANEVDLYFDLILEDYKTYENNLVIINQEIEDLKLAMEEKSERIESLQMELESQNMLLSKIENSTSGSMAIELEQLRSEVQKIKKKK